MGDNIKEIFIGLNTERQNSEQNPKDLHGIIAPTAYSSLSIIRICPGECFDSL